MLNLHVYLENVLTNLILFCKWRVHVYKIQKMWKEKEENCDK
jgi:hypothetical protein